MKDGIIKGTGNSRYLKSALTGINTWEDFKAALLAGTLPIDLNGINAAGWQQIGTALNKANLMDDVTCDVLGVPRTASVNDALLGLSIGAGKYGFAITLLTPGGRPMAGQPIEGVTKPNGTAAVTDSNGYVLAVATTANPTISISTGYADIVSSQATTLTSTGVITSVTWTLTRNSNASWSTAVSTTIQLSADVKTLSYQIVSAGGGGGGGAMASGYNNSGDHSWGSATGGGGGSGYMTAGSFANNTNLAINLTVGAPGVLGAGAAQTSPKYGASVTGSTGGTGGATSIVQGGTIIAIVQGGIGGTGGHAEAGYLPRNSGGTGGTGQVNGSNGAATTGEGQAGGAGGVLPNGGGYGNGGRGGSTVSYADSAQNNGVAGTGGACWLSWTF